MTLKNSIWKAIASIIVSDDTSYKSASNMVLFSRVLQTYPSKSIYFQISHRVVSYFERNVFKMSLIIESMREEGEDDEIINAINSLRENPEIKTQAEVVKLCQLLSDYVKYAKILKVKDSFIQSLDMISEDDDTNIPEKCKTVFEIANAIVAAYNVANVINVSHVFDTMDKDGMLNICAECKDARNSDKVIITGIRLLNSILSPGYLGGCVYIYAALPGNYKSGILLKGHTDTLKYNEHIKNMCNNKTPISMYISMENTMVQTIRRLWSLLYPSADMSMFTTDEICEMIEKSLSEKGMRSVILYYGYREKSTTDLGNIIRSYNNDNYQVVALFLDYIKRIRPGRTDAAAQSSEKAELHAIMNELKLLAAQFDIPIVSGHQLNREAARAVDDIVKSGGFNKTDSALGRGNISVAWEVVEVADWLALMNIENNGESKQLIIKAAKQRDLDGQTDSNIIGLRHPFITANSFALKDDIMENVSMSLPIYVGRQQTNYMAKNI